MHFRLGENADPSLAFTRRTHRPLRLDVSEEALSGSDDDVITKGFFAEAVRAHNR